MYSPLINGVWTLRYAGGYSEPKIPSPTRDLALFLYSGGYSPGLFALGIAQKLPSQLVELGDLVICESEAPYLATWEAFPFSAKSAPTENCDC